MSKPVKDKILAVLGAALLGYYIGMSQFRTLIWDNLLLLLPPMNTRHLPLVYPGIITATVAALLGYFLYILLVEKKGCREHKKQFFGVLALLLITPVAIAGIFRLHSTYLVNRAESTIPTEIRISFQNPGESILFSRSDNSAVGLNKSISLDLKQRTAMGPLIKKMKLKIYEDIKEQVHQREATLWIDYDVDGDWYSRILAYGQGLFEEQPGGSRLAYYENKELETFMHQQIARAADLSSYHEAKLYHSGLVPGANDAPKLSKSDFRTLVETIRNSKPIKPATELETKFRNIFKNQVKPGDKDIYAIQLLRLVEPGKKNPNKRFESPKYTENFMVYSKDSDTLYFEGKYYSLNLDRLVNKYPNK
ncbi:MAG: hypothetical protein M0Z31_07710 [Clostridia bacterium]|nr:hypothetical protein [Clostridia bacterium]